VTAEVIEAGAPAARRRGAGNASRAAAFSPGSGCRSASPSFYLGLMILLPLSTVFLKTAVAHLECLLGRRQRPRALAAYRLSLGASFLAAAINAVFGLLVRLGARALPLPGRRLVDALVDLPFALRRRSPASPSPPSTRRTAGSAAGWCRWGSRSPTPASAWWCAHLHRPAVRGAHRAAGARRPRPGSGGGRRQPRRQPPADPSGG